MRLAPTLLTAAILVATSCAGDSKSAATAATTTTAVTVDVGSEAPKAIGAVECVHTDPAKQPISVHRALSCPDGTSVAVKGIVTRGSDGSTLLCDAVPGNDCLKIDGGDVVTGPSGGTVWYTGTVTQGCAEHRSFRADR